MSFWFCFSHVLNKCQLLICISRGVRHDCGTALNEATTIMGYWVWSTQRTCSIFPTWQRAKPRTLSPTLLTLFWFRNLMSGHDFIQTGETARLFLFTSLLFLVFISSLQGKSLDSSWLFDRPTVPVLSIDREFLYNSQNWAFRRPHEFEYQLLQSTPAPIPFRSV